MRVYLIGFMGSGKTEYGQKLAEKMNQKFYDTDALIVEKEKRSINKIFLENGENGFREIERDVLRGITDDKVVVSTGGGTPVFYNNIHWMNQNGLTVFLKTPVDMILDYLKKNNRDRPLLHGMNENEIENYVKAKMTERMLFYRQAQYTISPLCIFPEALAKILNNR